MLVVAGRGSKRCVYPPTAAEGDVVPGDGRLRVRNGDAQSVGHRCGMEVGAREGDPVAVDTLHGGGAE